MTELTALPKHWIEGRVLGSILDHPHRVSLIIQTPDGTVVRVKGEVEVVVDPVFAGSDKAVNTGRIA